MSTSPATPGPEASRTPSTNLLSSVMRALSSMTSGTNRNPPSDENTSVEDDPDGNILAEDDPDESVAGRVQLEGISLIHRMQRVTDRLEREAGNLLDNPQRQMDKFRTLVGAAENVLAAHLFYGLTSGGGSSDRKFIGSEPKSIRLKTELTKCSSSVDQVGLVSSGGTGGFLPYLSQPYQEVGGSVAFAPVFRGENDASQSYLSAPHRAANFGFRL